MSCRRDIVGPGDTGETRQTKAPGFLISGHESQSDPVEGRRLGTGFDFGPPGYPDAALLTARFVTAARGRAHPDNERLKIDRDRLQWTTMNRR